MPSLTITFENGLTPYQYSNVMASARGDPTEREAALNRDRHHASSALIRVAISVGVTLALASELLASDEHEEGNNYSALASEILRLLSKD